MEGGMRDKQRKADDQHITQLAAAVQAHRDATSRLTASLPDCVLLRIIPQGREEEGEQK